ncbi:MAG: putative porin [Verrucomicrobiota bacterium]|nr:putative porin [Verrucomicrobiota bacterium]
MFAKKVTLALLASALAFGSVARLQAQDSGALLDLLVRKKIITDQEAEEIRGELTKEYSSTSAGKVKLSQPLTELEVYGDARVRYENRSGRTTGKSPVARPAPGIAGRNDSLERSRERYRLRLGLRGTLADDWFFGLRLETSSSPRSTNVTFGGDANNGPYAKTDDGINVGQAYLGYRGFKDVTLTVGRMPMPLVTTLMVWDEDINPEGIAEQWKHSYNFGFGGGSSTVAASATGADGKSMVAAASSAEPWKLKVDLFANFAQFVYDDANPENPLGQRGFTNNRLTPNTDAWLFAYQVGAKLNFPKNRYFQAAPVVYHYSGLGDTFNSFYRGGAPDVTNAVSLAQNQTGVNSLLVLEVPTEFGFKIGERPFKVFGDFAVNFDGAARAAAAGRPDKGNQRYAYQIGAAFGQVKAKGDWQLQSYWMHSEQYALDPNLVDSDFWDSRVNMEGVVVQASYAVSDAVTFKLSYGLAHRADRSLGTGGTGDIGINPLDRYQLFQADLGVKF